MSPEEAPPSQESKSISSSYPAGYHDTILKLHGARTAESHASHLIPYLKPGQKILDVGCGPGSITVTFAPYVGKEGQVIGVDPGADALIQARQTAQDKNVQDIVTFQVGDGLAGLPFPDGYFDVVHAHQVLQHVSDPLALLKEMKRCVAKKEDGGGGGGIISLREGDFGTVVVYPENPDINNYFTRIYAQVAESVGANPRSGRRLHAWCRAAGLTPTRLSTSTESFGYNSDETIAQDERRFWGLTSYERLRKADTGMPKRAVELGLCKEEDIVKVAHAWKEWAETKDAFFTFTHFEVICKL